MLHIKREIVYLLTESVKVTNQSQSVKMLILFRFTGITKHYRQSLSRPSTTQLFVEKVSNYNIINPLLGINCEILSGLFLMHLKSRFLKYTKKQVQSCEHALHKIISCIKYITHEVKGAALVINALFIHPLTATAILTVLV